MLLLKLQTASLINNWCFVSANHSNYNKLKSNYVRLDNMYHKYLYHYAKLSLNESKDSDMFRYLGCNFITSWLLNLILIDILIDICLILIKRHVAQVRQEI
jgi:hypothetical protein